MKQHTASKELQSEPVKPLPTSRSPIPPSAVIAIQRRDTAQTIEVFHPGWWTDGKTVFQRSS